MLKKLLKHDFISVWRLAFPTFAIATGIILFSYGMCRIDTDNTALHIFSGVLFPTGIIVAIVACILVFVLPILHFYRNLMTGEGYLSFTLPVTTYQLVLSKLIVGAATTLFNMAFTIGAILLLISSQVELELLSLKEMLFPGVDNVTLIICLVLITIIVAVVAQQMYFFLAIALGQMLCKNKIAGSALGYVIIYMANQAVNLVLLLFLTLHIGFKEVETFMSDGRGITLILSAVAVEYVILGIAAYILSCRILKNRLNLS